MIYIKTLTLTFFLLFLNSCGENTSTPITTDISDVKIDQSNPTIIYSTDKFLPTATAYYLDDTQADATNNINWKVSDSTIAYISNDLIVFPLSNDGNVTLTAGYEAYEDSITLDIVGITDLNSSWWISTADRTTTGEYELKADGNYTDGTSNTIKRNISWVSSDTNIATISTDESYATTLNILSTGTFEVNATVFGSSVVKTYTIN